ncbi:hypothetical protein CHS0354_020008 [Potamilus streckersoni]|uniref:AB hydrolase-1 domain-containing protein n=1 Tax=Potamilus streckersoni TaxID=2493646 RepID=A0AAE0SYM3_9BIVA|nr:hypothetical protein CHS0354_020008 [Potamilus streckersoni]
MIALQTSLSLRYISCKGVFRLITGHCSFTNLNASRTVCRKIIQSFTGIRCYSTNQIKQKTGDFSSLLQERYIVVLTSVGFWEDVPEGVLFDVGYLDSHPAGQYNPRQPTIVGIHDTPGTHGDLIDVLEPFAKLGYRVVIPNFPGFGSTRGSSASDETIFQHTLEERGQFLADFIANLGIPRIDLLVGLRSGCHLAIWLSCAGRAIFKAIALISPSGHKQTRATGLSFLIKNIRNLWDYPLYRILLRGVAYIQKKKKGHNSLTVRDEISAFRCSGSVDYNEINAALLTLAGNNVPRCIIYGKAEPDDGKNLLEDYSCLLSVPASLFSEYDENSKLIKSGDHSGNAWGVRFEKESLNLIFTEQSLLIKTLLDFLNHIKKTGS